MTDKQLKDWMERFFDAELTVDEERELYRYLCANEVSAELRKDREVILALCSTAEEDIELPEGAAERLEEMLDGLEEMKEELQTDDTVISRERSKIVKIPRLFLRAACAAAVEQNWAQVSALFPYMFPQRWKRPCPSAASRKPWCWCCRRRSTPPTSWS